MSEISEKQYQEARRDYWAERVIRSEKSRRWDEKKKAMAKRIMEMNPNWTETALRVLGLSEVQDEENLWIERLSAKGNNLLLCVSI